MLVREGYPGLVGTFVLDETDAAEAPPLEAAGATVDVSVAFDAGGLLGGDYFAEVVVASNDPDEPGSGSPVAPGLFRPVAYFAVLHGVHRGVPSPGPGSR